MAIDGHFFIGGNMENLKIGIIVADVDEYKPFEETIKSGKFEKIEILKRKGHKFFVKNGDKKAEIISVLCGIGKVNAAAATTKLIDMGCNIILNYGLSGGVSNIRRGDISAPDKFLEHDFDLTGIGYKLCEKPLQEYIYFADRELLKIAQKVINKLTFGTAVSGDHFICDSVEREKLKNNFNAMSCDMETAAMAYVCSRSDVPFLALRRISDDAGDNALDLYREMNSQDDTLLSDYLIQIIKELL